MGCHPSKEIALLRALTEAAQGRATMISGARDDNNYESYARFSDPKFVDSSKEWITAQAYVEWEHINSWEHESHKEDLSLILERLALSGLRKGYTFNLTSPLIANKGLSVIRAIVPGLETYHHTRDIELGNRARSVMANA
jgi:ribosomal protein S12 methylthiotransferase accessory factor